MDNGLSAVLLEFCGYGSDFSESTARKMAEEILRLRGEVEELSNYIHELNERALEDMEMIDRLS